MAFGKGKSGGKKAFGKGGASFGGKGLQKVGAAGGKATILTSSNVKSLGSKGGK